MPIAPKVNRIQTLLFAVFISEKKIVEVPKPIPEKPPVKRLKPGTKIMKRPSINGI